MLSLRRESQPIQQPVKEARKERLNGTGRVCAPIARLEVKKKRKKKVGGGGNWRRAGRRNGGRNLAGLHAKETPRRRSTTQETIALVWFLMAPIELNGTQINSLQLGESPKLVPRASLLFFPSSPLNQGFVTYESNSEYVPSRLTLLLGGPAKVVHTCRLKRISKSR